MTHDWDLVERLLLEVRQSAHENFAPRAHAERLAEELCEGLENLARTGASDLTPVAYLGISAFAEGDSPADLLARADQALAQAESQRATAYVRPHEFDIERYRAGAEGIAVRLSHAYLAGPSAYLELAREDSAALIEAEVPESRYRELGLRDGEILLARPRRARIFAVPA